MDWDAYRWARQLLAEETVGKVIRTENERAKAMAERARRVASEVGELDGSR